MLIRRHHLLVALGLTILALAQLAAAQTPMTGATPIPRFSGPIPVSEHSYPYLAADKLFEPIDLAKFGYVEEEFFVNGHANVYDWAQNGDLSVKIPRAPYTTRILVRRPADPARFSGNVIVEVMHNPFGQDFGMMWGWAYDTMVERRDAWVAVSVFPSGISSLKKFNPTRYARLSFANPNPTEKCDLPAGNPRRPLANANNDSEMEEGLRWDAISQVGALLKSDAPGRPMARFNVERLYMTTQDTIILTYINAMHRHAKLASGRPVYDGYLVKGYVRPARIRRCAPQLQAGDPRIIMRNVGVPVIHLQMEGDFPNVAESRRDDSDAPGDPFRLYEIAGTAHFDSAPNRWGFPSLEDMANGGYDLPFRTLPPNLGGHTFLKPFPEPGVAKCEPEIATEQPILGYVIQTAFAHLDDWVRKGVAPPRAARLEMVDVNTPQARVATDRYGNGVGGLRTPLVDVPYATFHMHHDGSAPLCRQYGWEERFDWATLQSIHGSYKNFAAKVEQTVAKAVADRWLTPTIGEKVKREMLAVSPAPPRASGATTAATR